MIPVSPMMDGAGINAAILGTQAPLLPETDPRHASNGGRRQERRSSSTVLPVVVSAVLLLGLAAVMIFTLQQVDGVVADGGRVVEVAASRGVVEGVSEKTTAPLLGGAVVGDYYGWTNAMLSWQRTAFHFQPPKNWMNG
ncbi:hypothetical protein QOZ80_4AG0309190 [Eleusine coracana subsp. coracana]|nr:hypothetical protein QOZ80_4AG0309190 [Eleusine coracana subsp. coracana]